ncbi:MAG TPA: N-acetyltransferase, partial [Burkholderiales bacterium]|nr:N-acetyltransferase [Burkholderiales bacterium]
MVTIRPEQPDDIPAVRRVHEAAFPTAEEAKLVDRLRTNGKAAVSLVAHDKDGIVGHILFSPVTLDPPAAV